MTECFTQSQYEFTLPKNPFIRLIISNAQIALFLFQQNDGDESKLPYAPVLSIRDASVGTNLGNVRFYPKQQR